MFVKYVNYDLKDALRCSLGMFGAAPLGIVWMLCAMVLPLCRGCRPQPPDLTACTRIEVHYVPGAINYFFPSRSIQEGIFSKKEKEYLGSYDVWTVTDQERIRAFAYHIGRGNYRGKQENARASGRASIICYQGSDRTVLFTVYGRSIVTESGREFEYPAGLPDLTILDPSEVKPLKTRWECALNLSRLLFNGLWPGRDRLPYPDPNQWCDVIVQVLRSQHVIYADLNDKKERAYPDTAIAKMFTCPSVRAATDVNDTLSQRNAIGSSGETARPWRSDYALNPHCAENSPKDMVFLFESKPGWNQHGGPELFTFDNHDPKGGLVLLNDGTVKFIRTEEELKQLRWK